MSHGIQIGKVAEQTSLSIDTIRFYQKIGLVRQPARSEGGFRLFSAIGKLAFGLLVIRSRMRDRPMYPGSTRLCAVCDRMFAALIWQLFLTVFCPV